MNKKIKVIIMITLILGVLLVTQMRCRNDELYVVNLKNKIDKNLVSILVSDKEGNYSQYESNTFPSNTEYTYNSELSKCQDNNGNIIEGILNYNETTGKVSVRTKKTTYCYLYFDYLPKNLDESGANPPKLASGMIPVYYNESDSSWHKADETNLDDQHKWYDYDNKIWANAVTVTSINRSTYQNAALGTKIADGDINTMFVWIPRYKYTVWNYNADGTASSEPQEIQITFESENDKTGEITCTDAITGSYGSASETCKVNSTTCTDALCNGKTYTHPAFTFGSDELTGFWVGKFETTGTHSAITIKPNLSSLRNYNVSTFFTSIAKMKNSGNAYGFSTNDDTHMIKNIEWGAIAYLHHSKYGVCTNGTCTNMYINNSSDYITGKSGNNTTGTSYTYNTENGVKASTTRNIYGIYDMSGGSEEFVMGNTVNNLGKLNTSSAGSLSPSAQYYDKYSYGSTYNDATAWKRGKLGDATKEVITEKNDMYGNRYNWSSYFCYVPDSYSPWHLRGGVYIDAPGIFSSYYSNGGPMDDTSSRVAIAIK